MNPNLQTRDDAIELLRASGFQAPARDWSFGQTVCVGAGVVPDTESGILACRHLVCIHPEAGQWAVSDLSMSSQAPGVVSCGSLANAVHEAMNILNAKLARETNA